MPAFSGRAIQDLYPLYWSKANELVNALRKHTQGSDDAVEMVSWTSRSALDVIGVAAWGRDFDAISEPDSAFLKTYSAMFDISGGGQLVNALALAFPMGLVVQLPLAYNKRLRAAKTVIRKRCTEVVREKKLKLAAEEVELNDKDILSLLIRGGVDEDDALINQMMTMLAAGHDTSGLSLAWASYLLSKHADVQTKLRDELKSKLPVDSNTRDARAVAESLDGLPYLHAVANEILRLMAPVPTLRRETLNQTNIQSYHVSKGAHIVVSPWVSNRLEAQWGPDAESFDPDRWLDLDEKSDANGKAGAGDRFAFYSFSHGARACIGATFARAELLIFLVAIVSAFEMRLEDVDYEPKALFGITMSPASPGIRVKLRNLK